MLTISKLKQRNLEKQVLNDISFNARKKREVTALIGVNRWENNDYELYCGTITI